jgi:WD40 repeat protein
VLSGSADGTARVFLTDGSGEALVLPGHRGDVKELDFSPDGSRVATVAGDGAARIWRVRGFSSWVAHFRSSTTACLTPEERIRHLAESGPEASAASASCEKRFSGGGKR